MESTLVTTEQLKQLTSLSQTIDCDLLQPHLLIAQQLYVQPVLGDAMYNDLLAKFNNNSISGITQTLLDEYITPAIGFSAWFSSAPFLAYKTNRAGIQTQTGSDGSNVATTPEELSTYIQRVENFKDFYCERLAKWLYANKASFPLYRSEDVQPTNKGGQLYLGFRKARKNNYGSPDYYEPSDEWMYK